MTKSVEQWIRLSEYRLKSAHVLHESGQHLDAVFNLQQAVELMMKAWVANRTQKNPPKTHDLIELAGLVEAIPPTQRHVLEELHDVRVPLRYPDDFDEALEALHL